MKYAVKMNKNNNTVTIKADGCETELTMDTGWFFYEEKAHIEECAKRDGITIEWITKAH